MKEILITGLQAGQRLDRFLEKYLRGASTGFLYKMLRKKNITLNGKKAQGSEKLAENDRIRIWFSPETLDKFTLSEEKEESGAKRWPCRPLDILYEDEHTLLVNKPAGMLSQRRDEKEDSLCEYLIGYLLSSGQITQEELAVFRPSVCNRLDRGTSGIVCCGKTIHGLQQLSSVIESRRVGKYYECLAAGTIKEEQLLEGYLKKDGERNLSGITGTADAAARPVKTRIWPVKTFALSLPEGKRRVTLAGCELITGRSHQIRAHLADIGHPIAGDPKYGDRLLNRQLKDAYGVRRQLLHCAKIVFPEDGFDLPLAGRTVRAPLPEDFLRVAGTDPSPVFAG